MRRVARPYDVLGGNPGVTNWQGFTEEEGWIRPKRVSKEELRIVDRGQWTRLNIDTILHKGRRMLSAEYQLKCEQGATKCIDTRD